jgi:hypothetical protein
MSKEPAAAAAVPVPVPVPVGLVQVRRPFVMLNLGDSMHLKEF